MKIVKLDPNLLRFLCKNNPKFPTHGIGLRLYLKGDHIFIPLTSQKRPNIIKGKDKSKFFPIGKDSKNGTLLIVDYIYIRPHLSTDVDKTKTIESEIIYIKNNSSEVEKRIIRQINFSKSHSDKIKKDILKKYIESFENKNREMALKYTDEAIQSMAVIEKMNYSNSEVDYVVKYKLFEKLDLYDAETILNLKTAWEFMKRTLYNNFDIDYIIKINELIAHHQALKVGEIRDQINYVSGEFEMNIPNADVLKRYLRFISSKDSDLTLKALNLFYHIVTNQWFYDGNKRTGFLMANKMLIESGYGILLLKEKTEEKFSRLLYNCYKVKSRQSKDAFFKFLIEECIVFFN